MHHWSFGTGFLWLSILLFAMKFNIFSISEECHVDFQWDCIESVIAFDKMVIFTILTLPIHGMGDVSVW